MHLKQIEAFVAVIKHKSFSKAAEAIYLSQPTISAHINSLESELGTKLIVRSTKEVYPSAAGTIFYGHALEILKLLERARMEVKSYSSEVKGRLEIAASTVPSQYILPEILPRMAKKYPNLFYAVQQYDSGEVVEHIRNMDAEVGITGTVIEKSNCVFEPFLSDRLVIITPNTPQFVAMNGRITAAMLRALPFVSRESGSGTRKESEAFLQDAGVDPKGLKVVAQMQSTESIKQAVKRKLGISIISRIAAEDYVAAGDILMFEYDSPRLNRNFYLVYHKNRPLSPAAEAFVREIKRAFSTPQKLSQKKVDFSEIHD